MAAQQPPQPPPADARAAAIASALTVAGTAGAVGATGGALAGYIGLNAAALAALTRLLLRWGYRRQTVRHAIRVATTVLTPTTGTPSPPVGPGGRRGRRPGPPGAAELAASRAQRAFAAWFLERTTARVEAAAAAADGDPEAVERALEAERRYVQQHLEAQRRRQEAARRVDDVAGEDDAHREFPAGTGPRNPDGGTPGDPDGILEGRGRVVLVWRAHPDDKVTPECRAADGAWFYADRPPIIGYPGMPHGGTCRCWPAHATPQLVATGRTVDEAVRAIISRETDHRPHPDSTAGDDDGRQTA